MMSRPRVLVLQPLFTVGEKLDYRMLGFQFWIAEMLTAIGFEGASALFANPDASGGPREIVAVEPPTDAELRQTLHANEARFGVVASFAVLGECPHLAVVRLVELRRGHPLRKLQRWTFDGETDHLPAAAYTVLIEIARRLGVVIEPSGWPHVLGTSNAEIASSHFTALGCFAACDQGFVVDAPELALQAALSGIAAGMEASVQLFPHLVRALLASGSAETDTVRAAVSAATDLLARNQDRISNRIPGELPGDWQAMLRDLGLVSLVKGRGLLD